MDILKTYSFKVSPETQAHRLDKYLANECPELTRNHIKTLIIGKQVTVNGYVTVEPDYKTQSGDKIHLDVPKPKEATPLPQNIPLNTIFEDEHLLVINKAAGMVVHPAYGNSEGTLVNALLYHHGSTLSGIRGVKMPGIVHRLDKDTSGLMVVAKSDLAHQGLTSQFEQRTLFRKYLAIVWGLPTPPQGSIQGNIGRHPKNRQKMCLLKYGGKEARTDYKLLKAHGQIASLVECRLHSGRTHQIRVHMTSIGCPLIGDPLYGRPSKALHAPSFAQFKKFLAQHTQQALHAYELQLTHPLSGKLMKFEAPLPSYMETILHFLSEKYLNIEP